MPIPNPTPAERLRRLAGILPTLNPGQLLIVERIVDVFGLPRDFRLLQRGFLTREMVEAMGDILMVHHCFSTQPLTKDKFEYALESVFEAHGSVVERPRATNPGHDLKIDGTRLSLKTQADKGIKAGEIYISKFMELGSGEWTDKPAQLGGLRNQFLDHLAKYDRVFTLRTLRRPPPNYFYELVEIPKDVFRLARKGRLEMKSDSRQMPKPGYCYVSEGGAEVFQLYFDGGTERKLQIKHLRKSHCQVHATWEFDVRAKELEETDPG